MELSPFRSGTGLLGLSRLYVVYEEDRFHQNVPTFAVSEFPYG